MRECVQASNASATNEYGLHCDDAAFVRWGQLFAQHCQFNVPVQEEHFPDLTSDGFLVDLPGVAGPNPGFDRERTIDILPAVNDRDFY